jgi:hypothetical protein
MSEMIADPKQRAALAKSLADAINQLVIDQYGGLHEEPDITSRIGQRLEDRFDERQVGGHILRVVTQTIPSHGPNSLERPLGTDLYIAFSVQPHDGPPVRKGLLIQAKRQEKLGSDWSDLREQCRRMNLVTQKGSVVWLYGPNGVATMRAPDVTNNKVAAIPLSQMLDQVFLCWIGDKRRVPGIGHPDRAELREMLEMLGAKNGILLKMKENP